MSRGSGISGTKIKSNVFVNRRKGDRGWNWKVFKDRLDEKFPNLTLSI